MKSLNYLTKSELRTLTEYLKTCKSEREKNSLKIFLIRCYSGLGVHEIFLLRHKHVHGNFISAEFKKRIGIIKIPLRPELKEVVGKGAPESFVVDREDLRTINTDLHSITQLHGIRKYIKLYHAGLTYTCLLFSG